MEKNEDRLEKFKKLCEEYKAKREQEKQERNEHLERFIPKWPYELFGIEC